MSNQRLASIREQSVPADEVIVARDDLECPAADGARQGLGKPMTPEARK